MINEETENSHQNHTLFLNSSDSRDKNVKEVTECGVNTEKEEPETE